jgi:hypothetical protein
MRPGSVEVAYISVEYPKLFLLQDEQMIETLTPYTAKEPLTDGIRAWGVIRSCKNLNVTRLRNTSEADPKLAVVITDKVLRPHTKGGGFPKRYVQSTRRWDIESRRRGSRGRECSSMRKKANSEWKKSSVTGRRVAGPDLLCMVV